MKLSDTSLREIEPRAKPFTLRDGDGLTIRVMPTGRMSWIFVYDFGGRRYNLTLGRYPEIRLQKARAKHKAARASLTLGMNPSEEKRKRKRDAIQKRAEPTIADLANEYIERHAKPHKRTWKEDERIIAKDVLPKWGTWKATEVKRRDVVRLIAMVVSRGGVMANRTLAVVRKMFNYGVDNGILKASPASGVQAPAKETQRERILTPIEIKALWAGLPNASQQLNLATKLLLVTGQRITEVCHAHWDEINFDAKLWTIKAARTKNKLTHTVPLSNCALEILAKAKSLHSNHHPFVFPSPVKIGEPITSISINQAMSRCGINFTPHDIRRTVGTALGELGFHRIIQDKVLNHKDNSVGGIYDRHSYGTEKREALEAWENKLQNILISGG